VTVAEGVEAEVSVHAGPLSLARPDPDRVAALVAEGLFDRGETPTVGDWYDPGDLGASAARARAMFGAPSATEPQWEMPLGVHVDGELVGVQTVGAVMFCASATVLTSSWLAPSWRGRGLGSWARAAALAVAFDVMGAARAVSFSLASNDASVAVSRRCGYRRTAIMLDTFRGELEVLERFELTAVRWGELDHPPLDVAWSLPRCAVCGRRHPTAAVSPVSPARVRGTGVPIRP
jgi:GNAT superfamily N-acetyltransferase